MDRDDLKELHYITHIGNVGSIMRYGILCNRRAQRIDHTSVAMQQIQDKRARRSVPGGRPLHDYVNLYLYARNPMMYRIVCETSASHTNLCVLIISTDVLDLPNVIITDGNAART